MKTIFFIRFYLFISLLIIGTNLISSEGNSNEFVVKKTKKKEMAISIKQDICSNLEKALRNINEILSQGIILQADIFDKIKVIIADEENMTTAQLKKYREKLELLNDQLKKQQLFLEQFSLNFD